MDSITDKIIAQNTTYGARNYKPLPVVLERGEGAFLWDVEGNRYLDMLSSYSAVNQGHCHPRIVSAMIDQAKELTLTSRAFHNANLGAFCEKLAQLCGLDRVLPMNSGAEAVETAIKAARKWGYLHKNVPDDQAEIIVCNDNFHGRTTTIISCSTEEAYRHQFGPFTPGFKAVPFGDATALEAAITPNTVAFLVEPIQGEAGIIVPPTGYLKFASDICKAHNVLLIADEIQVGLGRTGTMFCCDHDEVKPDAYILGKALSGGCYPVSAVVSREDVLGVFAPGEHGSTFGGNPLAAAIGMAAIDVIQSEHLAVRSLELGHLAINRLKDAKLSCVRDIRGKGLLIGVELKQSVGGARKPCEALMKRGVLCKETHEHVIRLAPPLVVEEKDLLVAVDEVIAVLTDL